MTEQTVSFFPQKALYEDIFTGMKSLIDKKGCTKSFFNPNVNIPSNIKNKLLIEIQKFYKCRPQWFFFARSWWLVIKNIVSF